MPISSDAQAECITRTDLVKSVESLNSFSSSSMMKHCCFGVVCCSVSSVVVGASIPLHVLAVPAFFVEELR